MELEFFFYINTLDGTLLQLHFGASKCYIASDAVFTTVCLCICTYVWCKFKFFFFVKIKFGLYFLDCFDVLMSKMIFKK